MDEIEEEERKRRRRLWILAAIAVLIGVLIALALTRDTTAEVPKVTGRSLERAETRLEGEGFKIGEPREVESEAEAGNGARAGPDPGRGRRRLHAAQLLLLEAGSGPHGQHRARAAATSPRPPASRWRRRPRRSKRPASRSRSTGSTPTSVDEGLVIHSDPSGGSSLTRGSTVVLTVSSGPKLAKVPVLVGYPVATAEQQIRAAGLEPSVTETPDSAPEGQVIRQTPSAGSRIEPGSTVTIVVSEGEETASVPNVIGKLRPTRSRRSAKRA